MLGLNNQIHFRIYNEKDYAYIPVKMCKIIIIIIIYYSNNVWFPIIYSKIFSKIFHAIYNHLSQILRVTFTLILKKKIAFIRDE